VCDRTTHTRIWGISIYHTCDPWKCFCIPHIYKNIFCISCNHLISLCLGCFLGGNTPPPKTVKSGYPVTLFCWFNFWVVCVFFFVICVYFLFCEHSVSVSCVSCFFMMCGFGVLLTLRISSSRIALFSVFFFLFYLSTSPNTISCVPIIVTTSANI
jgi:hypothetical protein